MATRGLPNWPWNGAAPDELPPAEAVLLDAIRSWVEATRNGGAPLVALRLPLVTEGLGEAAGALDAVLRALACPGSMGCRLCPRITPAEGTLLLGLGLAQRATRREALAAFLQLAPPAAAYAAMGPALALGLMMRRSGLLLANPLRATS
ncbi:hypothetical protein SAMN02745194_01105 [Roseomonas rosea]|jgi:hypothetical protein|uniref:Uncharacterized protein n=1 Tax=Muricoccus roseus TaxID=198092 RepID=A0A1M6E4C8_9PROT|nr:hypothetical protein [Roseomonas rosea]SHI80356.1 hypothetical protein SAMN02745194_01105 [Roseomonas rosea]